MCVKLSLWTSIFLVLGSTRFSIALCDRLFQYKPCCTGELWNSTEGKCVSCPLNHYGENCSFTCSLPEQGYRCRLGACDCNRVSCNVTITSSQCHNHQNLNSTRKPDTLSVTDTRLQDKMGNGGQAVMEMLHRSMCVNLSLRTVLLVLGGARLSIALCDGPFRYKPCCTGELWNSTEGKCVSCPLNHYGENCSFTCTLPEQGYRCKKGACKCNRVSCNVTITSSQCNNYQKLISTLNPNPSSEHQVNTRLQDKQGSCGHGTTAFMFIVSGVCGVVMCSFTVIAYVVAKKYASLDLTSYLLK